MHKGGMRLRPGNTHLNITNKGDTMKALILGLVITVSTIGLAAYSVKDTQARYKALSERVAR